MPRPANPHPYKKTVTRYLDAAGKQVRKDTPGAGKHTLKTSVYYADVPGLGTVSLKTTNLPIAWKRLHDRLREQHQRELGILDNYSDHARVPLADHLAAWLEVLQAKGTGQRQRDLIAARLSRLFALAGWTKLAQIQADGAMSALANLGRSAQTRNHYVTHLRAFCAWLVKSGRLPSNPVGAVGKVGVATDRRRLRRAPSRAELAELFAHLDGPAAPRRRGMTGTQRALAYRVAMATGYRASELRSLTPQSFDLDNATVRLAAAVDKRRRGDVHLLPAWLVEELRPWFAAGGQCWQRLPAHNGGRILKADLASARAAWIATAVEEGERKERQASGFLAYETQTAEGPYFWDMHSFRVWYITELANQPGMDLKTLTTLARHSTPQLSLNVYAKAREENLRAAQDRLSPILQVGDTAAKMSP